MSKTFLAFGHSFRTSTTRSFVVLGVYHLGAPPTIIRRSDSLKTAFDVRNEYRGLAQVGVFEVASGLQVNYDDYLAQHPTHRSAKASLASGAKALMYDPDDRHGARPFDPFEMRQESRRRKLAPSPDAKAASDNLSTPECSQS